MTGSRMTLPKVDQAGWPMCRHGRPAQWSPWRAAVCRGCDDPPVVEPVTAPVVEPVVVAEPKTRVGRTRNPDVKPRPAPDPNRRSLRSRAEYEQMILGALAESEGLRAPDLVDRCQISRQYVNSILTGLTRTGCVAGVKAGRAVLYRAVA